MPAFAFGNGLWYDGEIDDDTARRSPMRMLAPECPLIVLTLT